jgi:hypothetical protein
MARLWAWTAPKEIERDGGMIRFVGWTQYLPERVPAMWLRVAALMGDLLNSPPVGGWLTALREYGPLDDVFDEQPKTEEYLRDPWRRAIERLDQVAMLWRKAEAGVWQLPDAPIELAKGYGRLQAEFSRVLYDGVRLTAHGLDPVPEPRTLDAYLWLSAAESVRQRHRFKKCERCTGWFAVQRLDARFCSTECRRGRVDAAADVAE